MTRLILALLIGGGAASLPLPGGLSGPASAQEAPVPTPSPTPPRDCERREPDPVA